MAKQKKIGEIAYERISNWEGGMNDVVNDALLGETESPLLENASLDEKGTLSPRKGSEERYANELVGNISGMGSFYKSDGTTMLLIGTDEGNLYADTPHVINKFSTQAEMQAGDSHNLYINSDGELEPFIFRDDIEGGIGNFTAETGWSSQTTVVIAGTHTAKGVGEGVKMTYDLDRLVSDLYFKCKVYFPAIDKTNKIIAKSGNAQVDLVIAGADASFKHNGSAFEVASTYEAETAYTFEFILSNGSLWVYLDGVCLSPSGISLKDNAGNAITQIDTVGFEAGITGTAGTMYVDDVKVSYTVPVFTRNSTAGDYAKGKPKLADFPTSVEVEDDFTGTLTNTRNNNGLELVPAGGFIEDIDTTTADFATGTLVNVSGFNDSLILSSLATASDIDNTQATFATGTLENVAATAGGLELSKPPAYGITADVLSDTTSLSILRQYGWKFTVGASDIVVDKLRVKLPASYGSIILNLWKVSDQSKLATVTVASVNGSWVEGDIADTTLEAGGSFIVSAVIQHDVGMYSESASGQTFNPAITYNGACSGLDTGYPSTTTSTIRGVADIVIKTDYNATGNRITPSLDLSSVGTASSSSISWDATTPAGTSVTVETSTSADGTTWGAWKACTSGSEIPDITNGTDVSPLYLRCRQTLATTDTGVTPQLHSLAIAVNGEFRSNGTRTVRYDLSSIVTAGGSVVSFNKTTPTGTALTVETNLALDGVNFAGWQEHTSGNAIAGIASGADLSSALLDVRATLSTTDTTKTPTLSDISVTVNSLYPSSGTHTTAAKTFRLSGTAVSSSVDWEEVKPDGTTVTVEFSWDNTTWLACTNGGDIPDITGRDLFSDTFWIRETLSTTDTSQTPKITSLSVSASNSDTTTHSIHIEEGTTNLFTANQSDVETNTTGFTVVNGATLTRDTTEYWHGSACLKVVTDASGEGFTVPVSLPEGEYAFSFYAKGTGNILFDAGDSASSGTLTSEWQRFKVVGTVTPAPRILSAGAQTFYVDGLQLEAVGTWAGYATSWTVGTREPDSLSYVIPDTQEEWLLSISYLPDIMYSKLADRNYTIMEYGGYRLFYDLYGYGGHFVLKKGTTELEIFSDFGEGEEVRIAIAQLTQAHGDLAAGMHLWIKTGSNAIVHKTTPDILTPALGKLYLGCASTPGTECNGKIANVALKDIVALEQTGTTINNAWAEGFLSSVPVNDNCTNLLCTFETIEAEDTLGGVWFSPSIDVSNATDKANGTASLTTETPSMVRLYSRSSADNSTWTAWEAVTGDNIPTGNNYIQLMVTETATADDLPNVSEIVVNFDGTPSAELLASDFTENCEYYFGTLMDKCVIVNGVDPPRKYDGTTLSVLGGNPPISKYVAVHKNRMWFVTGSRVYFSDLLDVENWPVLNFIDISPNDGDYITGIKQVGDYLVIAKQHSIWILTGDDKSTFSVRRIHANKGAYAPRSLEMVNDTLCFVSDDGVYFSDFTQAVLISERVKNFWQGLNSRRLSQSACWHTDHKLYIAVPSAGSIVNDMVIVYDSLRQCFSGVITNWNVSCFADFREGGKRVDLFGHSNAGKVSEMGAGYSDNGTAIPFKWRSRELDFDSPEILKRWNKIFMDIVPATTDVTLTLTFFVDGAPKEPITISVPANSTGLIHSIVALASRAGVVAGRRFAIQVEQDVVNDPVFIHGINIEYMIRGLKPSHYA